MTRHIVGVKTRPLLRDEQLITAQESRVLHFRTHPSRLAHVGTAKALPHRISLLHTWQLTNNNTSDEVLLRYVRLNTLVSVGWCHWVAVQIAPKIAEKIFRSSSLMKKKKLISVYGHKTQQRCRKIRDSVCSSMEHDCCHSNAWRVFPECMY